MTKNSDIQIETHDWQEIDLDQLAKFSYTVKQSYEATYDSKRTIEREKEHLQFRKRFQPAKILFALKNGSLAGWLSYDTESPSSMVIGRWLPIIKMDKDIGRIFTLLIEKCKVECIAKNLSRIEVCFDLYDQKDRLAYNQYVGLYKSLDFELVDHEVYMRKEILEGNYKKTRTPPQLIYKQVQEVDLKVVYMCYYKSFENSKVHMFIDQTDKERKQFFEETLSSKKSSISEASLVLINPIENEVLGIIIVQARESDAHMAILAITPDYRRKKYGTTLVKEAISQCGQLGFKTMSLGVDADNDSAYNLYSKIGFEKNSSLATHAWKTRIET
ncbi:MAG: GNAT family N-acetyltransferase [Candidatus Hodarchaeales archaeon]|jgi:ribosomal protein S18 acetylase RimI-like enzyme